mmetsp:Transcript_11568/g.15754  ORF Transcript_11568/g.15754 Transcript_11568/m.15754 type:complete len:484 (-) Transcript_11568:1572-3023(-)
MKSAFALVAVTAHAVLMSVDISARLNASLAMYTRPTNHQEVEALLQKILFDPWTTVMILNNRLIVDRRMLTTFKGLHHIEFVKSVMELYSIGNAIYTFEANADGTKSEDQLVREGCPTPSHMPLARVKKTSFRKQTYRKPIPKFVIAKRFGDSQCGIFVPNCYFDDITKWNRLITQINQVATKIPFHKRKDQVFWRGAIRSMESCYDEDGNYARLKALTLTTKNPQLFDIRCTECKPRDENLTPCPQFPYSGEMRLAIQHIDSLTGSNIPRPRFSEYKYLLNLPGSVSGSYSRNLNHLWFVGSVILQWSSHYTEFYYPALKDGVTHINVNETSMHDVVLQLQRDERKARNLVVNARRVYDKFLCPQCLAKYFVEVIDRYRDYFSLHLLLDNKEALKNLFATSAQFEDAQLIALSFDQKEMWSRISYITEVSDLWTIKKKEVFFEKKEVESKNSKSQKKWRGTSTMTRTTYHRHKEKDKFNHWR